MHCVLFYGYAAVLYSFICTEYVIVSYHMYIPPSAAAAKTPWLGGFMLTGLLHIIIIIIIYFTPYIHNYHTYGYVCTYGMRVLILFKRRTDIFCYIFQKWNISYVLGMRRKRAGPTQLFYTCILYVHRQTISVG